MLIATYNIFFAAAIFLASRMSACYDNPYQIYYLKGSYTMKNYQKPEALQLNEAHKPEDKDFTCPDHMPVKG